MPKLHYSSDAEYEAALKAGSPSFRESSRHAAGLRISTYSLLELLGSGSTSCVYSAIDSSSGETVAIKLLKQSFASDRSGVHFFQRQLNLLTELRHPNIANVREFGILSNGQPFIVLDYIHGRTLAQQLNSHGPISLLEAYRIFSKIAQALEAAHHKGIVHLDIKPSNIMLTDSFDVYVIDFGIAKLFALEDSNTISRTEGLVGTPLYMSPEQCLMGAMDARSDIYSLGCVMFQSLSGTQVFSGSTAFVCMSDHVLKQPPSLNSRVDGIPRSFSRTVSWCLKKRPEHRLQSMKELNQLLLSNMSSDLGSRFKAWSIHALMILRTMKPLPRLASEIPCNSKKLSTSRLCTILLIFLILLGLAISTLLDPEKNLVSSTVEKHESIVIDEIELLEKRFTDVEKEISRLRKTHEEYLAVVTETQLRKYRKMYYERLLPPVTQCEASVVIVDQGSGSIFETPGGRGFPGRVTVKVTDQPNPVVLILYARHPVDWTVDVDSRAKLSQILFTGHDTVRGQPKDTKVRQVDEEELRSYYSYNAKWGGIRYLRLRQLLNKESGGAELVSAQSYESPREPIIVGPQNKVWLAQYVLSKSQDFCHQAMRIHLQDVKKSLENVYYQGIWRSYRASQEATGFLEQAAVGKFTPLGPVKSSLRKLDSERVIDAVFCSQGCNKDSWFILSEMSLISLSISRLEAGEHLAKRVSDGFPGEGWRSQSITYDTKNNRLILRTKGSAFSFFDPRTKHWLNCAYDSPNQIEIDSIAFCPEEEAVYGFGRHQWNKPCLFKFKNGKHVRSIYLTENIYETIGASVLLDPKLTIAGRYAILNYSQVAASTVKDLGVCIDRGAPWSYKFENRCLVIDRETGHILWSQPVSPHS